MRNLLPSEMFRVTEAMRPRFEDEAWARKILGKAADKARKKGRVDDLLADHVGISRGTLRKIREIYGAYRADAEMYGEIVGAMEKDRRIDKHYKSFKRLSAPSYEGPVLTAVSIVDWQTAMSTDAAGAISAIQNLDLKQIVQDNSFLIIPSSVDMLPSAVALLAKTGAKLDAAVRGADPTEEVILFGRFGAPSEENRPLDAFQAACAEGLTSAAAFARIANPTSSAVIHLSEAIRKE